jgi:hypothetical protein
LVRVLEDDSKDLISNVVSSPERYWGVIHILRNALGRRSELDLQTILNILNKWNSSTPRVSNARFRNARIRNSLYVICEWSLE